MQQAISQELLLAARPPSRRQLLLAYSIIASLLAAFCITLPYARLQLPIVAPFVPIYMTVIFLNNLITATLLFAQFWVVRWTWLLILANGFLFTAFIFVPFLLAFPGVFGPTGLVGGLQAASWFSIFLHVGILIFVIAALLVRGSRETTTIYRGTPAFAIGMSIFVMAAIVCAMSWLVVVSDESWPQFFLNNVRFSGALTWLLAPIAILNVIALTLLMMRRPSVLDLSLAIMCSAWLVEVLLGGVFAGSRYSVGWYTGRIFQIAATYIVLIVLLSESTALYANMARAAIQRKGVRQARQIAMDTMAASIGHEIKQPLTSALTNARAGVDLLRKPDPDLREIRATFIDIGEDCRRIVDIIGNVRKMFQTSTHDREPLDVKRLLQDSLAASELDLQLQRIAVRTELQDDLPLIFGDKGQLHQVFLNLIANAQEAMAANPRGKSLLTIRAGRVADSSDIAVTVEDTGVGISGLDGERVFEPFFSTKAAGTGVGLAICKVFIEAHGGRLDYCANEPYGTVFRVTLPSEGGEGERNIGEDSAQ